MENENPLVNLASLRSLLGDNNESIVEILNLFIANIPPAIADINSLLEKQDWDGLRKKVHSIKSYYGYVGNDMLNEKLSKWEFDLQQSTPGVDHHELMTELEQKSEASIVRIKQIIKEEFAG